VLFKCPHCNRHLAARMTDAGKAFQCPRCGGDLAVPFRSDRFPFLCPCGRRLLSKRSLIGAGFRCPSCKALLAVPSPATGEALPVAQPLTRAREDQADARNQGPADSLPDQEPEQEAEPPISLDDLEDVGGGPQA